jgi:hypothetical protein
LGSTLVPLFYPCCHPVRYYLGSLLVWRIGISVTSLELCSVDSDKFGAMTGGLRKPVIVIIPKSKDRSWSDHP